MLRSGFEPESPPRKGGMIGRTTPTEQIVLIYKIPNWVRFFNQIF